MFRVESDADALVPWLFHDGEVLAFKRQNFPRVGDRVILPAPFVRVRHMVSAGDEPARFDQVFGFVVDDHAVAPIPAVCWFEPRAHDVARGLRLHRLRRDAAAMLHDDRLALERRDAAVNRLLGDEFLVAAPILVGDDARLDEPALELVRPRLRVLPRAVAQRIQRERPPLGQKHAAGTRAGAESSTRMSWASSRARTLLRVSIAMRMPRCFASDSAIS